MMVSFCSGVARGEYAGCPVCFGAWGGAAVDDRFAGADDAQTGGDRTGRGRMVTGDEHRGDARRLAGGEGRGRGRPGRVEDADQPEQPQPALHLASRRHAGPVGCRHCQHAEAVSGQIAGAVSGLDQHGVVAGDHFWHQHGFRRAFADDACASAG
jgi:hypothetical protein